MALHKLIKRLLIFSASSLIALGISAFSNTYIHADPNAEALSTAYAVRGQNYINAFNKGGGYDPSLLKTAQDAVDNSRKYASSDDNSNYQNKMAKIDNDLSIKLTLINAAKNAFSHNSQGEQSALQQADNLSRNSDFNSDSDSDSNSSDNSESGNDSSDSSNQEATNDGNNGTYSNADYDNGIDGYWQHNNLIKNRNSRPFDELLPGHTYENYDELYIHQGDLDHYTKPADQVPSTFNYNLLANGSNTKFYGSDDNDDSYLYFSINPDNPNELDVNGDGFYRHYYRTSKRDGYRDMHVGNSLVNRLNREYQQWLNEHNSNRKSYTIKYIPSNAINRFKRLIKRSSKTRRIRVPQLSNIIQFASHIASIFHNLKTNLYDFKADTASNGATFIRHPIKYMSNAWHNLHNVTYRFTTGKYGLSNYVPGNGSYYKIFYKHHGYMVYPKNYIRNETQTITTAGLGLLSDKLNNNHVIMRFIRHHVPALIFGLLNSAISLPNYIGKWTAKRDVASLKHYYYLHALPLRAFWRHKHESPILSGYSHSNLHNLIMPRHLF